MKIAVNTRLLLKDKLEGIGWFTFETLKRITNAHPEHQFYFLFDRKYDDSFLFSGNIEPLVLHPQARHPVLYYLWFEHSVRKALDKIGADLFLSPDGYLSLPSRVPSLPVFHDLNFEHYPEDLPVQERQFYRYYFPRYAAKATRIATVSEFSRDDIVNCYGVSEDKIDVVYNGYGDHFQPLGQEEIQVVRNQYSGGVPYFLYVGALHPRKNLVNLFKAYDLFRKSFDTDIKLMVAGATKWWTPAIDKAFRQMGHQEDVIFTGRLDAVMLAKVMASAQALTYVSYFEGFGIPILEAFASGVPVITSGITSMPEVAGNAALYADPFSPSDICSCMKMIASDDKLCRELVEKGNLRKRLFSWDKTADALWNSIERAV